MALNDQACPRHCMPAKIQETAGVHGQAQKNLLVTMSKATPRACKCPVSVTWLQERYVVDHLHVTAVVLLSYLSLPCPDIAGHQSFEPFDFFAELLQDTTEHIISVAICVQNRAISERLAEIQPRLRRANHKTK